MASQQQSSNHIISPEFFVPDNTEDFMDEVEQMMRFWALIATRTEVVAAGVRKGLANPIGTKMSWARADLRVNASRVAHPIAHVASLATAGSKSWGKAWRTYVRLYQGEPAKSASGGWKV